MGDETLWPLKQTEGLRRLLADLERVGTAIKDYEFTSAQIREGGCSIHVKFGRKVDVMTTGQEFVTQLAQAPALLADAARRLLAADEAMREVGHG